jgi:hypothetical protein
VNSDPEISVRPEDQSAEIAIDTGLAEVSELPAPPVPPAPRRTPNIGHAAIFAALVLVVVVVFIIGLGVFFGVALALHWINQNSFEQLARNPLFAIPLMAAGEIAIFALSFPVFGLLWKQPFAAGIHINARTANKHIWRLIGTGIATGIVVQLLSNFLPIPKSLPIDEFLKTPSSVWVVAIFGVFVAPPFEELAFRGFLLPSLASAWDWVTRRNRGPESATDQPRWSTTALVLATILTSIGFTLVHAEQLAHAWAPLAVIFTVSIVLCFVRIRTGSLAASILVHASYNFSLMTTLFIATDGFRHLEKMHS